MSDYKVAIDILSNRMKFLRAFGYDKPSVSIEQSVLLGNSLLLKYESTSDRNIEIGYSVNNQRPASATIFISNSRGERFSLEDWVSCRLPNNIIRFAGKAQEPEIEFLGQFSDGVEELLQGALKSTLTGEAWDAVPFDWKGYR